MDGQMDGQRAVDTLNFNTDFAVSFFRTQKH